MSDINIEITESTPINIEMVAVGPSGSGGGGGAVDSVNGQTGTVVLDTDDISDSTQTNKYVTAAEKTKLSNLSGVNTGDQDLSGLVPYTGATTDVNLGTHQLTAHNIRPDASDGLLIESNNGTDIVLLGAGNTANGTWYGSHNFSAATQDTIAAFTGTGKTLGSLALANYPSLTELSYVKGLTSSVQTQVDSKLAKASNLSDVANAVTSFNNIKQSADTSNTGVVELATLAEVNAGTDTTRAIVPDDLAGSYAGTKAVSVYVIDGATTVTTGDGKAYFRIPIALNGMDLVSCSIAVVTKSTSGTPTVQLARGRQANATSAHTFADMLSTKLTIDANEYDSKDATTPAVIDTANDDVLTGDLIRIDVDVAGTGTAGLIATLSFRLP